MKRIAIFIVRYLINCFPASARRKIVKLIAEDEDFSTTHGREIISLFSASAGITGVLGEGNCGLIVSQPNDFVVHKSYVESREWATSTIDTIRSFFEQNGRTGCYIDIGANIGLTTIPIARDFLDVFCLSFEPDSNNFRNLQNNMKLNCLYNNYSLLQMAVFSAKTTLRFEISDLNLGDHRIRLRDDASGTDNEHLRKVVNVDAAPLDSFKSQVTSPLAIKIDTQGAEPFVVKGGSEVLRMADLIIVEWCPYLINRLGGDPKIVLDFIASNFVHCEIHGAESHGEGGKIPSDEAAKILMARYPNEIMYHNIYYDIILTERR